MDVLKAKLDEYMTGTESYMDSRKRVKQYIAYRLSFIEKEAAKMLNEGKSDQDIQAYIDKSESALKMMTSHLELEADVMETLLDVINDFETEKAQLIGEIHRLQNRVQEYRYGLNNKPMTTDARRAAVAEQYRKWHDFH